MPRQPNISRSSAKNRGASTLPVNAMGPGSVAAAAGKGGGGRSWGDRGLRRRGCRCRSCVAGIGVAVVAAAGIGTDFVGVGPGVDAGLAEASFVVAIIRWRNIAAAGGESQSESTPVWRKAEFTGPGAAV